jgi:predicted transcriptional regulator
MKLDAVITARIPSETAAILDRAAALRGQSRSTYISRMVQGAAQREAQFLAFIQEGIDSLDRGEGIPHDVVVAELDEVIAAQAARCKD